MKAVGLRKYRAIDDPESLVDVEIETPEPGGRDLLVKVLAIAVNPVDTKVRKSKGADAVEAHPRILGWDATGVVEAIGAQVTMFKPGDEVFYAGSITRAGANSEYHLVDERIAALKPKTLTIEQAAALPLTSITAWEALFDRLGISKTGNNAGRSLLIIGGAGGVGSIAIQLARQVADLKVIATASRKESLDWVKELGAQYAIDHFKDMPEQLAALGFDTVDYVLICNDTDQHFPAAAKVIKPQGGICTIVENSQPLAIELLKPKSAAFHWEMMFTRPMFETEDMIEQHNLLTEVARLVDAGTLKTTVGQVLGPINAQNLRQAHKMLEGGRSIGKIVLAGF